MYKPKENALKYNAGRPKDKDKEQQLDRMDRRTLNSNNERQKVVEN